MSAPTIDELHLPAGMRAALLAQKDQSVPPEDGNAIDEEEMQERAEDISRQGKSIIRYLLSICLDIERSLAVDPLSTKLPTIIHLDDVPRSPISTDPAPLL